MEEEEFYRTIKFKLEDFNKELFSLEEFSTAKIQADINKDIEEHFESLFKAIQKRKDELISYVDKFSKEIQTKMEEQKKQIKEKIELTNKVLESGSAVYQLQRDLAIGIWETSQRITYVKKEKEEVQVGLSSTSLLKSICSYGTVDVGTLGPVHKPIEVRTLAGSTKGNTNGNGINAQFNSPHSVAFNPLDSCLYVCEYNNSLIRKVNTKTGEASKFATHLFPAGIAFSQKGNCFYVSSWSTHSIHKISLNGEITLFAGGGDKFKYPHGITVNEETGDIYVSDCDNHVIRKITPEGVVSTIAGIENEEERNINYSSQIARLFHPSGICFHPQFQSLFVCDSHNNRLKKISLDGNESIICEIEYPRCVSVLSRDSILVVARNKIFKLTLRKNSNKIEVFAGSEKTGDKDGEPLECEFNGPWELSIDHKTNTCFVADNYNHKIKFIKFSVL